MTNLLLVLRLVLLQEDADGLHVVVVSIDGLRPDFYLSEDFDAPTLKSFVEKGAHAKAVEPVYPSVTYPGHATIVTGVRPCKHGIYDNTQFGTSRWYGEFRDLRSRTLWEAARERGRTVAIISWPTSLGADVNWIIPENHEWGLIRKHSTAGLIEEILGEEPLNGFPTSSKIDALIARGAAHVLRKYKPDLLMTHLSQLDSIQHSQGRSAAGLKAALRRIDGHVADLLEAAREAKIDERTVFLIVGDHGFADFRVEVAPNLLLIRAKLIDLEESGAIRSWKALAHGSSGSLMVYAKDAEAEREAHRVLEAGAFHDGNRLYSVLDRARLDELGYNPEAAMALEAEDGIKLIGDHRGEFCRESGKPVRGAHGYLPTKPSMATGFLARGPRIRTTAIRKMMLVDVAPTIATILGLEMKEVEGRTLDIQE